MYSYGIVFSWDYIQQYPSEASLPIHVSLQTPYKWKVRTKRTIDINFMKCEIYILALG